MTSSDNIAMKPAIEPEKVRHVLFSKQCNNGAAVSVVAQRGHYVTVGTIHKGTQLLISLKPAEAREFATALLAASDISIGA